MPDYMAEFGCVEIDGTRVVQRPEHGSRYCTIDDLVNLASWFGGKPIVAAGNAYGQRLIAAFDGQQHRMTALSCGPLDPRCTNPDEMLPIDVAADRDLVDLLAKALDAGEGLLESESLFINGRTVVDRPSWEKAAAVLVSKGARAMLYDAADPTIAWVLDDQGTRSLRLGPEDEDAWAHIHALLPADDAARFYDDLVHDRVGEASPSVPPQPGDKVEQALFWPGAMLTEIQREAVRLDRSLSWCVQWAWKERRHEIRAIAPGETSESLEERFRSAYAADGTTRRQSLFFAVEMWSEMKAEAERLDRSISWVVQRAWCAAVDEIRKLPSVNPPE